MFENYRGGCRGGGGRGVAAASFEKLSSTNNADFLLIKMWNKIKDDVTCGNTSLNFILIVIVV